MNNIKLKKEYHCGELRPYFRGVMHLLVSVLMFLSFIIVCFENNYAVLGSVFVFASYVISAVFHLIHFESETDYRINILDHFGVQLHGIGMQMLSMNFNPISIPSILQTISFIIDDILCIYLHNYISNIFHHITFFLAFTIGFFGTIGFDAFYNIFYFCGMSSYIIGGLFYVFKHPKSNEYWGFHELYHLFAGIGDIIFFYDAYTNGNL